MLRSFSLTETNVIYCRTVWRVTYTRSESIWCSIKYRTLHPLTDLVHKLIPPHDPDQQHIIVLSDATVSSVYQGTLGVTTKMQVISAAAGPTVTHPAGQPAATAAPQVSR